MSDCLFHGIAISIGNPSHYACHSPCKAELTLEGNALTGPIPPLTGLIRLREINLGNNFLTSTFPTGTTRLVLEDLRSLTLRDNLLSGPIPSELGLAPRLGKFLLFQIPSDCNYLGYILTLSIVLGI